LDELTDWAEVTVPSSSRTAPCGAVEARSRLRTARAYLEVSGLVLNERDRDEHLNVSAGLAVLAGTPELPAMAGPCTSSIEDGTE